MSRVAGWIAVLGGVAQKQDLVALGATDRALAAAVHSGAIKRVRRGWYSDPHQSDEVVRAIRVGGRLTGLSAIRFWGGWAWSHGPLHVSVAQNSSRFRSQWRTNVSLASSADSGVVLHWDSNAVAERGTKAVVSLRDALLCVVIHESLEEAVAALDWALHTGLLDRIDFENLIHCLPKRLRWIRDWVDERCESFPESLTRTRLRLAGYRVRSQVRLDEVRRIDLVVEDLVAIEVDGKHSHRDRFLEDRRRDLEITLLGYHVLRPAAVLVFNEWDLVLAAVDAALARTWSADTRAGGPRAA